MSSGSIVGALIASYMPVWLLEPILLSAMIGIALLLVLMPGLIGEARGFNLYLGILLPVFGYSSQVFMVGSCMLESVLF